MRRGLVELNGEGGVAGVVIMGYGENVLTTIEQVRVPGGLKKGL